MYQFLSISCITNTRSKLIFTACNIENEKKKNFYKIHLNFVQIKISFLYELFLSMFSNKAILL